MLKLTKSSLAELTRCSFINAWGDQGASIAATSSQFMIKNTLFARTTEDEDQSVEIKNTYTGSRPLTFMIKNEALASISAQSNQFG